MLKNTRVEAFWIAISHLDLLSVGINCALGPGEMRPYVEELARLAPTYVSCYPNAGLPNAFGQYDERPEDTGGYLQEFAESGFVNIVGGCCGTTPEHIAAIAERVAKLSPRMIHHKGHQGHKGKILGSLRFVRSEPLCPSCPLW